MGNTDFILLSQLTFPKKTIMDNHPSSSTTPAVPTMASSVRTLNNAPAISSTLTLAPTSTTQATPSLSGVPGSASNISLLDWMHTTLEDLKARVRDDVKAEVDTLHAKIQWLEERVEVLCRVYIYLYQTSSEEVISGLEELLCQIEAEKEAQRMAQATTTT